MATQSAPGGAPANDYLHVGDLIVLEESASAGSFVVTEGHDADASVAIRESRVTAHTATAVFLLRAQQNTRYEKQLSHALETDGIRRLAARGVPKYNELFDAAENEARLNELEFAQKQGSDVRYGMVVQLQQHLSGRTVCVARTRAESGDGYKVTVEHAAGENGWFRILP
eukprot:7184464-Prymnesium_polylepis.1